MANFEVYQVVFTVPFLLAPSAAIEPGKQLHSAGAYGINSQSG